VYYPRQMHQPRIVILGGGFGGLFTALDLAGSGEVTLVSDEDHFLFTPMLYEYLSGEVEAWHIAPRYDELIEGNVRFVKSNVTGIDLASQSVSVANQKETLNYDVLVLAVGGITNYVGVEGAEEFSLPFRKLAHADNLRRRMVTALDHIPPDLPPQDVRRELTFAVVGAGASGCELSTKMADLLVDAFNRRALHGEPRVLVIEMGDKVVPGMGDQIREFVEDALRQSRVEVHTKTRVIKVSSDGITFEHEGRQESLKAAGVVWTGGVRMNPLIEQLEVEKNRRGLLRLCSYHNT
jgi:NADH:ubiquinone reductase (non-electrogenic)